MELLLHYRPGISNLSPVSPQARQLDTSTLPAAQSSVLLSSGGSVFSEMAEMDEHVVVLVGDVE